MNWTLQLIEVVVLLTMGTAVHLVATRIRRPLLRDLEALAGRATRVAAAIADLVVALVYGGFAAIVVPPPTTPLAPPFHVEGLLEGVGLGALVLAALEVGSLLALHRVAHNLEPWPPKAALAV